MGKKTDTYLMEIGKRVEAGRIACGITREDMDRAMIKPAGFMEAVENGTIEMMAEDLYLITQLLNVSADYLLMGNMQIDFNVNLW